MLGLTLALVAFLAIVYTAIVTGRSDDYCRGALDTSGIGAAVEFAVRQYHNWTSRWLAMALYALTFPKLGMSSVAYKILILMSIPLWITVFYLVMQTLYGGALRAGQKLVVAMLLTAIYWSGMPAPAETWYWATGFVEYQFPVLLTVFGVALLASRWALNPGLAPKLAIAAVVLALVGLVTGLNELIAVYFLGFVLLGAGLAMLYGRLDVLAVLAVIVAVGATALWISVGAPGNDMRLKHFDHEGTLVGFIYGVLTNIDRSFVAWLVDPKLVAFAFLMFASPIAVARPPPWASRLAAAPTPSWLSWWGLVPCIAILAVFFGRVAYAYNVGGQLPGRVSNTLYAFFIFGLLVSLPALSARLHAALPSFSQYRKGGSVVAAVVLALGLLSSQNTAHGIHDLPKALAVWLPEQTVRIRLIQSSVARGERDIVLEEIEFHPRVLRTKEELGRDPEDWQNRCMARYFGADSIRIE